MAVVLHVEHCDWLPILKNRNDADVSKIVASPGDRLAVSADFSSCVARSRLLIPIETAGAAVAEGGEAATGLRIDLSLRGATGAPPSSIEWVALVQGPTPAQVAFHRKLADTTSVGADASLQSWTVANRAPPPDGAQQYLALQFAPHSAAVHVVLRLRPLSSQDMHEPARAVATRTSSGPTAGAAAADIGGRVIELTGGLSLVCKTAADAKACVVETFEEAPQDPGPEPATPYIVVDPRSCRSEVRLLWRLPAVEDALALLGPDQALPVRLRVSLADSGRDDRSGLQWAALTRGPSPIRLQMHKSLARQVRALEAPSILRWDAALDGPAVGDDPLYFTIQIRAGGAPVRVGRPGVEIGPPQEARSKERTETVAGDTADWSDLTPDLESLARHLDALSGADFAKAWNRIEDQLLSSRMRVWFKEQRWPDLIALGRGLGLEQAHRRQARIILGRALLYASKPSEAAELLNRSARDRPGDPDLAFYAGVAQSRLLHYEEAEALIQRAIDLKPDQGQYHAEHAEILRRMGHRRGIGAVEREALLLRSAAAWTTAIETDSAQAEKGRIQLARIYFDLNRMVEALKEIEAILAGHPRSIDMLILRSQALLALGRLTDARSAIEEAGSIDPAHHGVRFHRRTLAMLAEDAGDDAPMPSLAVLSGGEGSIEVAAHGERQEAHRATWLASRGQEGPGEVLRALQAEWLTFDPLTEVEAAALLPQLRRLPIWCGRGLASTSAGRPVELWRRDLATGLLDSGLVPDPASLQDALRDRADVVSTVDLDARPAEGPLARAPDQPREGLVVVMSRHGTIKFGGGEQFLDSMAEHYESMGYRVIVAGTRPELVGQSGVQDGRAFTFLPDSAPALRRFFLETRPAFVHVLSGLGYEVAEALEYLDIPFIYGIHFWRDCLGLTADPAHFFADGDRGPVPRPAFRYILRRAAVVYSNSEYTQEVVEEAFQVRTPILYSLPRELPDAPGDEPDEPDDPEAGSDFVLLANAQASKGFDLILKVAALCPDIPFVAIASQSDGSESEAAIARAGVANVRILPRTDRMDRLYRRARVVAVPSYRFIETFSRVCIEAHRFGVPVLGSDRGNVPYLLRESGVILPEDPEAWAAELRRLWDDPAHRADLSAKAIENSTRYGYESQRRALQSLVASLFEPVLIGVGSGLGNMLHVGPMIRNLALHLGRPVDIVVNEDHQRTLQLLHNPRYVRTSQSLRQSVVQKRYEHVFLTHCFGTSPVPLQGRHLVSSRSWMSFNPAGPLHETLFNLEAAKVLLGVDYEPEDVLGYSVGAITYDPPPGGRRIGFHAGSKDDYWTSKRWPHYRKLGTALTALGYEVASFGIESEYVEDTLNLTGGTIAEMVDRMRSCSYFVTNDSGLMNIANALGIPLTALFAPTNPATRGPLRPTSTWLAVEKDCAPCEVTVVGRKAFQSGQCACIAEIPLERVLAHVAGQLERYGIEPAPG